MNQRHNKISCVACMNLVMCGKGRVRCTQGILEKGRKVLLKDILDKRIDSIRTCECLENMRVERDIPWQTYLTQLRKNFCGGEG